MQALVADATDATAVRRALDGADVAYYLVHSLDPADFGEVDRRAAETFTREAARARVSQIVYLGGLGDDSSELSPHLLQPRRDRRDAAGGLRRSRRCGPPSSSAVEAPLRKIVALVDWLAGDDRAALELDAHCSRSRSPTSSATPRTSPARRRRSARPSISEAPRS